MAQPIEELRQVRLQKLAQIKKLGITPYPARCLRKQAVTQALKMMGKKVAIAGRIMAIRGHGGIQFLDLRDESGKIQLVFKQDQLSASSVKLLGLFDVGDFIDVSGEVFKTQAGEISVLVSDFRLLTKSIRPLPSAWYGLKDVEERYRKRYLDMILNPEVVQILIKRSKITYAIRKFLVEKKGYLEVENPVLQPIYGGGRARPFITHHNTLDMDLYLRISNELYLKRLIAGGMEKVFEMGHTFRNEGMDRNHNPEFTMLETMEAYIDYQENMNLIEEMFEFVAKEVFGTTKLPCQGKIINYQRPWRRVKLAGLFKEHTGIAIDKVDTLEKATALAKKMGVEIKDYMTDGEILLEIFEKKCTNELVQPTFVYDYPADFYPLAKKCADNPKLVESFDIYVAGMEMGTNWSEQNDPQVLREAWEQEGKKAAAGNEEAQKMDEDFLEALEYGMPPTSGIGPGIDRWVMVMTDTPSIRDVILFPTLRPINVNLADGMAVSEKLKVEISLPEVKLTESKIPKSLGITRAKAVDLLKKYLKSEKELNHLYATEAAMNFYAKKFGGNLEAWRLAGLLHDLDWDFVDGDMQKHGKVAAEILRKEGICEPIVYAILAHVGFPEFPRKSKMDSALWGSEELTGLILAIAKGRLDKQVKNITKETVLRAYKNLNFASGVSRAVIRQGAEELGIGLEEHIANVLEAMKTIEYSL